MNEAVQSSHFTGGGPDVSAVTAPVHDTVWEGWLHQLVQFKAVHGHCFVPLRCPENPRLGAWLAEQTEHFHQGRLPPERQRALEALGYEWDFHEQRDSARRDADRRWEEQFAKLLAFKAEHGHCEVPTRWKENPTLANWVINQRCLHKRNRVSPERVERLEQAGFLWRSSKLHFEHGWEGRFAELVAFKERHGHLRITLKSQSSPGFMHWRDNQRINRRNGTLTPERQARLDAIGFEWECPVRPPVNDEPLYKALWNLRFDQLMAYQAERGHCQVPKGWQDNPSLAKWVSTQREHYQHHRLPPERQARLEQIGFEWRASKPHYRAGWKGRFAELVAFKERHGHLHVTGKNQTSPGLKHWRDNQRLRRRSGVMPLEQQARLDAIGFEWLCPGRPPVSMEVYNEQRWEAKFARLLAFKTAYGHCQVPSSWQADPGLAKWVQRQRLLHHGKAKDEAPLRPERAARLEAVGFTWQSTMLYYGQGWEGRFAQLVAFKEQHGHLLITKTNQKHPGLLHWRDNQRLRLRDGTMPPEQKARLDALGFDWTSPGSPRARHPAPWDECCARLTAFWQEHGHIEDAALAAADPVLADWVRRQRVAHALGALSLSEVQRLDALRISWATPEERHWQARHAQLAAWQTVHGHCHVPRQDPSAPAGLASWLQDQRAKLRKGTLIAPHQRQLDTLGWLLPKPAVVAAPRAVAAPVWDLRLTQLAAFKELHGHLRITRRNQTAPGLAQWCGSQRSLRRQDRLRPERTARLDALGFAWEPPPAPPAPPPRPGIWDQRFEELRAFLQAHGHTRIPKPSVAHQRLRGWVVAQRVYQRRGTLRPDHQERLAALGFDWNPGAPGRPRSSGTVGTPMSWDEHFERLRAFHARHGHTRVPRAPRTPLDLGEWAIRQRSLHRTGKLLPERARRLEEIGFLFQLRGPRHRDGFAAQPGDSSSERRYAELLAFHAQHGHADVPTKYPPNPKLGNWVSNTRISRKKGQLSPARIAQLDALGFLWVRGRSASHNADFWERRYAELIVFKEQHGHPNVPSSYQANPGLARWVTSQRVRHRQGRITDERKQKLTAIGLRWTPPRLTPKNRSWEQRLRDLALFKQRHGHPHLSDGDTGYTRLNTWLKGQRVLHHHRQLPQDKVDKLSAIGIAWNGLDGLWERTLLQWRAVAGRYPIRHIPVLQNSDRPLALWEAHQRKLYNSGRLRADRISMLKDASFLWDVPPDVPEPIPSRRRLPRKK